MSSRIKEKDLIDLGFIKESSADVDADGNPDFYYYTYGDRSFLITCANDELMDGMFWYVEFFEVHDFKPIIDLETLKELIAVLNRIKK